VQNKVSLMSTSSARDVVRGKSCFATLPVSGDLVFPKYNAIARQNFGVA